MSKKLGMVVTFVLAATLTAWVAFAGCGSCDAGGDKCADCTAGKTHAHTTAELGKPAPAFTLQNHHGDKVSLAELTKQGKIVVLEWFNPDCPFVKYHYGKTPTMNELAAKYAGKNVVWLSINSSHYADQTYNADWAAKWNIQHPVLNDKSGEVGQMYQARTTPHMFVIDLDGKLVYEGAIDNNPKPRPLTDGTLVNYVDEALAALTSGQPVKTAQTKAYGCSVKYGKKASAKKAGCSSCSS